MNTFMRSAICAGAMVAGTAMSAFCDDLTLTSRVTRADGKTSTALTYISKDRVLLQHGDGKESLVDGTTGLMTSIDTNKRTYYVTTRADMDAFMAKMAERMNSPEMKKAQAEMQKHSEATGAMFAVDVHKTGGSRKIAGFSCDVWTLSVGKMSTTEECLTNELKLPVQIWDMYKKYSESMRNAMASMGPMGASNTKMQDQMKNMKGYPLSTQTTMEIMGHKTVVGSEVTSVSHASIPASAFQIPAGYTKVENPMMKSLSRMKS